MAGDVMAEEISLDKTSDADGDKKSDPAIQRLQIYVGLVKFLIGTVALGAITFFFNEQYRNAQLDLEKEKSNHAIQLQEKQAEVEYLSKFVANAMDKDIKVRVDFADYMKSVALSTTLQKIWSNYYIVLSKKADEAEEKIRQLEAQKQDAAKRLASVEFTQSDKASADQFIGELQDIDRKLYRIQEKLDTKQYGSFEQNYFDFQTVLGDAATAQLAGNYTRQRDLLLGAVERVPKTVKPYVLARLAESYRSLHDFSDARQTMQAAVDLTPNADSLTRLAIMQKNDHRIDLALNSLNKAAQLSQGADKAQIELITAGYLIHNGQRDEGLKRFADLEPRLQPRDDFITNIAWFNAVADRKEEFYEAFERSLAIYRQATLLWIDQEVDIDKYRNEDRFKQLVGRARAR
jgi:NADH dehydrogenase/NADH:ubiquinone oxidoreductase subunit G